MFRLRDVFNTIYLTDDYASRLSYVLDLAVKGEMAPEGLYFHGINEYLGCEDKTLDIADCRFTRDVADVLDKYAGKIYYVDTQDAERNRFVQGMSEPRITNTVKFGSKPVSLENFATWAGQLEEGVIYNGHEYDSHPEILVLLALMRPEITVVSSCRSLFKYTQRVFRTILLEYTDEFLYMPSYIDSYWDTRINEDGMVEVVNKEMLSVEDFVMKYPCMPACIGQIRFDPREASTQWKRAVKQVMTDVAKYLSEKPVLIAGLFPEEFNDN